jgi:hypothetical protein
MRQIWKKIIILLVFTLLYTACGKDKTSLRYEFNSGNKKPASYPDAFFAVISDTHIYSPELGYSGTAFEDMMNSDRKLLLQSMDLMDFAINNIITSGVSFVLIPGDLTKDSEMINHHFMEEKLNRFKDAGIAVYVVPGNHDINSPDSVRFIGESTRPFPSANADDFVRFYGDFGYNSALMRDTGSLSYIAEPVEGLWLLAIDACRYRENSPDKEAIVSGRISQETADWIASVLKEASSKNKAVMAVMHHGFMEHWKGQAKLHPDYIIQDYANFTKFLASWNVRVGFTGHYHAQDITRADFNGKFFYDIETGSLVTAPCPIRYIEIKNNIMDIRTETIVDKIYTGTPFAVNATAFVKNTVMLEAAGVLKQYRVSDKDIAIITDAVGDAFTAHYNGDENPTLRPPLDKSKLSLWGRFILSQQQYVLDGLWNDLPPADNNVRLQL